MSKTCDLNNIKWPFKAACQGKYPAIMMFNPRAPFNVGAAVRAASIHNAIDTISVTISKDPENKV